jgi:hypothetical protein
VKVKVSEATGPVLDWMVAKAEGRQPSSYGGAVRATAHPDFPGSPPMFGPELHYSTDWSQGGPIIEREELSVGPYYVDGELTGWEAFCHKTIEWDGNGDYVDDSEKKRNGPTPLIAAMRCFVASKLGDEVDVPEELL